MVLSRDNIIERCINKKLITPYEERLVQTCSYDMTFSGEYYYYSETDGDRVNIGKLEDNESLYIPAESLCYVLTEESVNMPNDLTASISLSFGLIKKGVMLAAQPPYDPGYRGKTVALLHNLSNDDVKITKGDHILNIVFNELKVPVDKDYLYKGQYQDLTSLKKYCDRVRKGAIFVLKKDIENQKKRFDNFLPTVLSVITIIIAVLTILFTFLTIGNSFKEDSQNYSNENQEVVFYTDEQEEVLIIWLDGIKYEVELKE